jgi:hypothetical protein
VAMVEINVESSYNALYNALQNLSSAVFKDCFIFQNVIENNDLNSVQWNISLAAGSPPSSTFTVSSFNLHGKGANVAVRQVGVPNANLSGTFSISSSATSLSSVPITITATAELFQSQLNSLVGVHGVNVTKKVYTYDYIYMYMIHIYMMYSYDSLLVY